MIDEFSNRISLVAVGKADPRVRQAILNQLGQSKLSNPSECLRTSCMSRAEWRREHPKMRSDLADRFIESARAVVGKRLQDMGLAADWSKIE